MAITTTSGTSSDTTGPLSLTGLAGNIDANALISKLMVANSGPLNVINKQHTSVQTKLSAFGKFADGLTSLHQSLAALSNPTTFSALSGTSSNAATVSATVKNNATPGIYNVNVTQLAQAQTISSEGIASATNAIGQGENTTITFQFGTITGSPVGGKFDNAQFTPDGEQASTSITVSSANNSLQGIANTINSAGIGIKASIIGDGSATPYHLVLSSMKSGVSSSLKIDVSGDPALKELLANDPSGTQHFTQVTAAQNATLTVNGIAVSSTSNNVGNVIDGVNFALNSIGSAAITVAANTSAITTAINNFVTTYNSFVKTTGQLTSYNATTKVAGAMLGDPTVRAIQNQIQAIFSQPAAKNNLSLPQIGITFQRDGTLAVNAAKLQTALSNSVKDIGELFSTGGSSSDAFTKLIAGTTATKTGTYPIHISQIATHGELTGSVDLTDKSVVIDENTRFKVTVDHINTTISLPPGSYSSTQLAALLQGQINGNKTLSDAGVRVTASIDNGHLAIQSQSYGDTSSVQLSNDGGTDIASFLGTINKSTVGKNVAGTINGAEAVGKGKILTATKGNAAEGLTVEIEDGKVGGRGSISYSRGYAYELESVLSNHLSTGGQVKNEINGLNRQINQLQTRASTMQTHLTQMQKLYQKQFTGLDTVLGGLMSRQSFLASQLQVLNGKKNS